MTTADQAGIVFLAIDGFYDKIAGFLHRDPTDRAVARMIMESICHECVLMAKGMD